MTIKRKMRIGLTMRVVKTKEYEELRDALAHDWIEFMGSFHSTIDWVPVPNVGEKVLEYIEHWNLDGFILTGGNDIGEVPVRDETEIAIIDYAVSQRRPVFGVCRALQLLQSHFGGQLDLCSKDEHVAAKHKVKIIEGATDFKWDEKEFEVNSFHHYGITEGNLAESLEAFAVAEDGLVEGVKVKGSAIWAVMWHPERGRPFKKIDQQLINHCFDLK